MIFVIARAVPITVPTWIAVTISAFSGATLAFSGKRRRLFAPSLLFCAYLIVPGAFQFIPGIVVWSLFDDAGGRNAYQITPGLRFGADGPNTALLESYAGPLESKWKYAAPHSPFIRDGNERVHSRNIIQCTHLGETLQMLPNDIARRAVVKALIDPENRLRVHQSLLLTCLYCFNYPPGTDRESWWSHHEIYFYSEYNPVVAASLTQDWLANVTGLNSEGHPCSAFASQWQAAKYQQQASWGGHSDFGHAFQDIVFGHRVPDSAARDLGQRVIWWPKSNRREAALSKAWHRDGE